MPKLYANREEATAALELHYKDSSFIPLIGEPLVVRYYDANGKKQAILAIGKATGQTAEDKIHREYHIIDTAEINENVSAATFSAVTALDLASAATQSVNNYFVILRNMIEAEGIDLDDGSYFDDDDPTKDPSTCGKYKPLENSNYLDDAKNLRDADKILDGVIGDVSDSLDELSGATASLSGTTQEYFNNIIEAAGLTTGEAGKYPGHNNNTTYITDAVSLDNADVLLDAAISGLSANTMVALDETNNNLSELSAATINLSAGTIAVDAKVDELSANTVAADQALSDRIAELESNKVLGVSAITVEALENGDSKVSLVINEEDDKVLSQNGLGLKANVSLVYNREDKKIYLKGKNDTTISEVDARDFIKDGMLSAASVFTATEADHEQYPELVVGKTYIKLLFNVDGEEPGRANPVFISAEDLVDIYTVDPELHPELNTFMKIDDYVIKLNVDAENGLASYNYARNISAVTANIISATGLNMGEQGGYPGHDETHYIKNAGNLDQADVLLDEAVWAVSGMVVGFDERITELEEDVAAVDNRVTLLSGVTAEFSAATNAKIEELSARTVDLGEVYEYIDSGDTALKEHIDEVEEVTAGALNDLNERVGTIETHFNGEYIPLTGYELASGLSEDELIIKEEDSVNDAFGKIQKQILDNEEAIAAGLNDLDRRVSENAEAIAQNTGVTVLSATVQSFSSATYSMFNRFGDNITNINEGVHDLSAATIDLSGAVMSMSAKTNGVLTLNLNGVEQGKYCPSASTTINLEAIQEVTGEDVLLTGYELATGATEEELAVVATDTVNDAFGKIQKQIYDNEVVTAGALNDLNDKITDLSGAVITLEDIVSGGGASSHDVEVLSGDVISLSAVVVNNQTKIQTLSGDVADCFDGAEYVSSARTIIFKHGGVAKGSIDASDFIKDGMVSSVTVSNGNLVISFNTDAGREDITLSLSQIFNPDNYYNKTEINALSGVVANNVTNINNVSGSVVNNLNKINNLSGAVANNVTNISNLSGAVVNSANNISNLSGAVVNNLNKINNLSGSVENLSGAVVNNRNDINSLSASLIDNELVIAASLNDLNGRVVALSGNSVDFSNYYTKDEVDAKISGSGQFDPTMYYNTANTYNKTEINNLLSSVTNVYSSSTSFSAITSTSARTSFSAITATSARTSLSATTSLSAQTALSAMTAKNLDLRYTTSNTLANLTLSEFLTIATITASTTSITLSFAITGLPALPANGVAQRHIIIENTGRSDVVVEIADDPRVKITPNNNASFKKFAIDARGRGELNVLITYDGSAYAIYVITT